MVSVTSEVSANTSFQNAAARSARPDSEPSAGNDSFAALVDSNKAASNNDNRTQDNAPTGRRSDDTQAASDNRSRDNAAASDKADKAARNDSIDRNAAAKAHSDKARSDKARDDGKVDANANADTKADTDTKATTTRHAKSKSDAQNSDGAKSDEATQASSGDASPKTDQTETVQDGTAVVTADAIAVAIPAAAAPAATASATQATDKATAPLAIAAAAIAASASLAAETAPAAPAAEATEAAATVTQPANAAQAEGGAKTSAQGAVGQAVSAQTTSVDPSTTGIAQAASMIAATTPAATKAAAQLKNPDLARKGATTAVEQAGTTDTAAPATPAADTIVPAVTSPTEAAGKPKSDNGIADAVKADASGNSITPPAANTQAHAHLAASDIGQTPVNSSGNGLQAAGAIQTQQPAASITTPATAAQLTATAAANTPVPVSGLAMEIAASAKSGKTRFEIRLDPAELGRIDVRIDIDRHGQMTSHLTVERPETLSMLRQDANQLQRALDNAGLSTGNGGLQFSLRDQSSQGQNDGNQSNPNAHRLVVSEEDSVPAVVAGRNYGRMLGASGGVDIRI
ncbi:flagellar hook-length control protein FliK [Bradyrhizobium sp. SRL28]|uniref:flagellar hook-length control protein FliK n=1 Tax=Bradyrhizobium sp. SRL28 TaxID=2836178 RepID=UPI001BDF67C1|nr:flagellar hook-length control protein FliK [Bradyrhizobium sp. SRL28]MBT1510779.1 flagellar hook-length control protein FliK [Bradyrhizobium sp. SRL28]